MSYTPPEQQVDDKLEELLAAIEDFRQVMWARIRAGHEWNDTHVRECKATIDHLNNLEVDLREKF